MQSEDKERIVLQFIGVINHKATLLNDVKCRSSKEQPSPTHVRIAQKVKTYYYFVKATFPNTNLRIFYDFRVNICYLLRVIDIVQEVNRLLKKKATQVW